MVGGGGGYISLSGAAVVAGTRYSGRIRERC